MLKKAYLFVFEGPDGVGKTTLAEATSEALNKAGLRCEYLAFPGKKPNTLGHHIYNLHHDKTIINTTDLDPTSLQTLHIAAHLDTIANQIKPLLESSISIVLDRYWWSTLVYGKTNGANMSTLLRLVDAEIAFWGNVQPDQIFLIKRSSPIDRDVDKPSWQKLVLEYKKLAKQKESITPVTSINNTKTSEETLDRILQNIEDITKKPIRNNGQKHNNATQLKLFPDVFYRVSPAIPSAAYDSYWYFAAERQKIFFKRFQGESPPWTTDPVLEEYKFTNAYRASDRVSQYLIQEVIYKGDDSTEEVFFRIMLFKIFNKIETWELLTRKLGEISYKEYNFKHYDKIITQAMDNNQTVFSAAYIMPSGSSSFGNKKKHRNYLKLLSKLMNDEVPKKMAETKRMREAFELLLSYPMIGNFLAYQYVTDINYSCITDFSEMEFVAPGPGAISGIRKCFESTGGLNDSDIIKLVTDLQEKEFEDRGIDFKSLWGRHLQLIDCQNLFCEVDKYSRVMHPDISGVGKRTRIKQKYNNPDINKLSYWYPPKWGLNKKIAEEKVNTHGD